MNHGHAPDKRPEIAGSGRLFFGLLGDRPDLWEGIVFRQTAAQLGHLDFDGVAAALAIDHVVLFLTLLRLGQGERDGISSESNHPSAALAADLHHVGLLNGQSGQHDYCMSVLDKWQIATGWHTRGNAPL